MVTTNEHVVVGDGVCEEIAAYSRSSFYPNLCAAEVGFELTTLERHIDSQHTLHVSAHLDECIVTGRQVAVNSDTYS